MLHVKCKMSCVKFKQVPHSQPFERTANVSVNHPDEMCGGLSRLKNLGLGLQSEIESQDDSIDSLLNKADKMDLKIRNTNQQIKNLK